MPAAVYVSILVSVNFECRWKFRISFWALRNRVSGGSISVFLFFFDSPVPRNGLRTCAQPTRCPPKRHAPRAHTRLGFVSEDPLPPSLALRLTPSLGSSVWSTADACTAFERPHGTTSRGQVRERQKKHTQPHSSCVCVFPCTGQGTLHASARERGTLLFRRLLFNPADASKRTADQLGHVDKHTHVPCNYFAGR